MLGHRTLSLDDYLGMLKRRWLLILIPAVILPIVALAITYRLTPIYTSQTLVLIDSPKVPDDYVKPVVETNLDSRLASMKEQILSRSRLEPIIKQYNLGDPRELTWTAASTRSVRTSRSSRFVRRSPAPAAFPASSSTSRQATRTPRSRSAARSPRCSSPKA